MKLACKIGIAVTLLALASVPASAAEMANLRNGFAIRHERHELRGDMTRLYLAGTADNYVEVPTADVVGFETIDEPVLPALSPPPAITLDALVSAASSRNNIDPDLIFSVIRAESGFNPNAVSPKGAPGSAERFRSRRQRRGWNALSGAIAGALPQRPYQGPGGI